MFLFDLNLRKDLPLLWEDFVFQLFVIIWHHETFFSITNSSLFSHPYQKQS